MSDPRASDWTPQRRALAWFNIVLQAAILLALLVVVNLIARKSPKRFDLTSRRSYHLSNISEDVLKNLSYDVEIWLNPELYNLSGDKSLSVAVMRTADLLEEMTKRTPRITVKRVSAEDKADLVRFRTHWNHVNPASLYILATLGTGRTNKNVIEIPQLFDGNAVTGEVTSYRGEPAIVGSIRELGGTVKHVVYESDGHEEYVTADKSHMGALKDHLSKDEGIEFVRLPLNEFKSVPNDCELLMIMGPAQPFVENELQVIRDYLERGGSLLVAVRPRVKTGLEKLLLEYSVAIGDNVVYDPQQYIGSSQTNLRIKDFNIHDINKNMVNLGFYIPDCCTVDPMERKDKTWRITPLAMAGEGSWEEKGDTPPGKRPEPNPPEERVGNMKLIVVVEKPAGSPVDRRHEKAKIDVWGSFSPFTNSVLYYEGRRQDIQLHYVINHFRWLLDRPLMDIKIENISVKPLQLDQDQISRLFWIVVVGFPAFGMGLGILAWFARRK